MQLGMIGLGRMGGNMADRCMRSGHSLVVTDLSAESVKKYVQKGAMGAGSLEELVSKLAKPRNAWVMLPSGEITENCVSKLGSLLEEGDVIIDGGNSFFQRRYPPGPGHGSQGHRLYRRRHFRRRVGLERGYCMMIGGPTEAVRRLDPVFKTLAPGVGATPPTQVGARPPAAPRWKAICIAAAPAPGTS